MSEALQRNYSQHPFLRDLQLLQFAVELAEQEEKEAIARIGLKRTPVPPFLGRSTNIEARPIYGRCVIGHGFRDMGLVYEDGLMFKGEATGVDYSPKLGSIYIAVNDPRVLLEEEVFDEDLADERECAAVPEVDEAYVGVLDILKFGVDIYAPRF